MDKQVIGKEIIPKVASNIQEGFATPAQQQQENSLAFQAMDKRDDELIVSFLEGQYSDEYVYEYEDKKHNIIRGLSIIGINEACREYEGIQCPIEKLRVVDTETNVTMTIEAVDVKTKSSALGACVQDKKPYGYSFPDPFYYQKCLSKAQRNAKRQVLPQELIKKWIDLKKGGTKKVLSTPVIVPPMAQKQPETPQKPPEQPNMPLKTPEVPKKPPEQQKEVVKPIVQEKPKVEVPKTPEPKIETAKPKVEPEKLKVAGEKPHFTREQLYDACKKAMELLGTDAYKGIVISMGFQSAKDIEKLEVLEALVIKLREKMAEMLNSK